MNSESITEQNVNGIKMSVNVAGSGSPLLFVHGFPLNHKMWQSQIDFFQNKFFTIAPDLRGFGRSEVTQGIISMEQHADDLNTLLNELKIEEPVIFCGLSMGGYIAWEFWKKYSHRLQSLILCDTRANTDSKDGINTRLKMVDLVLKHGSHAIASSMIPNLISEHSQNTQPEIAKCLVEMIESTDPEGIAASQRGMAERKEFSDKIVDIQVPTLLIVGSEDRLTPPDVMKTMHSRIPGSKCIEIPDVGHMSTMEAPDFVNQAIDDFLSS